MKFKYTEEILQDVLERDHAVLISHDDKLSKRAMIQFICQCGKEEHKIAHELVKRAGAFCRECCVKKGVEKTKNTLKLKYNKIPICTLESLYDTITRDNAILLDDYKEIKQNAIIHFRCHCGEESEKNCLQLISVSGAFCKNCTRITWTNKTYNTNMERYGVTCSVHAPAIQQKSKETVMKHYGVENVFQSEEVKQQINKTILEKYGVEHIMQHEGIKQKQKDTNMERYGVEYSTQREEVKEKMKQSCMKKYGVEYSLQAPEVIAKAQQTCLERYGVRHSQQLPEFKEKTRQTFIKHYGVSNPNKTKEVRDKIKQTCLKRYGVEHPAQSKEIAEKTQKNSKKYKEYQMPSGTIRKVQGYEPFALNTLLTQYSEEDIKTDRKDVPRISYTVNGISKYYFPDIYITSQHKIIEVKSTWTYQCKADNIQEKANATQQAGYDYELWIYDRQGNKIETSKI